LGEFQARKSGTAKGAKFEIRRTQRKRRTDTEEIRRYTEGHREEVKILSPRVKKQI
jgi:hypothetical protein